jgi:hypothetical protein
MRRRRAALDRQTRRPAAVPAEHRARRAGHDLDRLPVVQQHVARANLGRSNGHGQRPARGQRAVPRRLDGGVIAHKNRDGRCPGSGQPPVEDIALASWLPLLTSLTPHGLRHGHQTWMDEAGIPDVLKSERMGHELSGMRGVYSHVSPAMRADLKAALQERWQTALRERARISSRSSVRLLDALLAADQSARA